MKKLKFIHILPNGSRFTDCIPADPDRHKGSIYHNSAMDGRKEGFLANDPGDVLWHEFMTWRKEVNRVLRHYGYCFDNATAAAQESQTGMTARTVFE
jgi:hypothetical protein